MNTVPRMVGVTAALLLLAACNTNPPAQDLPPSGSMPMTTTIEIITSGATDSIGYRVMIGTGGQASFVSGDGAGSATLPGELLGQLNRAVNDAKPLSGLPAASSCMKPVSFGTSTFVVVGGDRTPDLTCPANSAATSLKQEVDATVAFLKIRNVPRGAGKELPPQNY